MITLSFILVYTKQKIMASVGDILKQCYHTVVYYYNTSFGLQTYLAILITSHNFLLDGKCFFFFFN